jgi:hypothetical protein
MANQFQRSRWGASLEGAGLGHNGTTSHKGFISDPKSKAKSVVLSEEGEKWSKELFAKHFALKR